MLTHALVDFEDEKISETEEKAITKQANRDQKEIDRIKIKTLTPFVRNV